MTSPCRRSTVEYIAAEVATSIAHTLWTEHDASAISKIFTDDVVYHDVAFDLTFHGHDGVAQYLQRILASMPDFVLELTGVIDVCPGVIVTHWINSGTFRDDKTFADRKLEKAFSLPGTSVITMRGDKVASNVDYSGQDEFLAALDYFYPTKDSLKQRVV
jgi:hypothetical protein